MRYFFIRDGYQHYVAAESEYDAALILAEQGGYASLEDYVNDQSPSIVECDGNDDLEVYDDTQGVKVTKTLSEWMGDESGIICSELT